MRLFKNPLEFIKKDRVSYLDFLKLIAMLMVVFDHCITKWVFDIQKTQLYNYIFLTQIPIFMFVSGIFMNKHFESNFNLKQTALSIAKIAISLLVPFIGFSIIVSSIRCSSFDSFINLLSNCFMDPDSSLWFIWALFWMHVFLVLSIYIAKRFFKKYYLCLAFSVLFYVVFLIAPLLIYLKIGDLFCSKLILYYSIYFVAGFCFGTLYKKISSNLKTDVFKIILFIISIIVLAVAMYLRPTIIFDADNLINSIIRICGSFASIASLTVVSYYLCKISIFRFISKFGQLSLEFYYVHLMVLFIPFLNVCFGYYSIIDFFRIIGEFFFVIVSSFVTICIIKSNDVSDLVIFGKISKRFNSHHTSLNNNSDIHH